MVARLLHEYRKASPEIKEAGRNWYADARKFAEDTGRAFNVPAYRVSAVIAALSPQTRWTRNLAGAVSLIDAYVSGEQEPPEDCTLYNSNAHKAWRIMQKEEVYDVLGGPKVLSFLGNLLGNEQNFITVDTWMARIVGYDGAPGLKKKQYQLISDAIRRAAEIANEIPAQFQAIVWIESRGSAK